MSAPDVASRPVSTSGASALLAASEIWSFSGKTPTAVDSAAKSSSEAELPAPSLPDAILNMQSARADLRARSPVDRPKKTDARESLVWPPRQLSLALQGGGTFAAFTWGALERLLEEPDCALDTISGASAGAVNAALLACGLVEGGREGARAALNRFWMRMMHEASFRSLMLVGGFSPAGRSVAFGPTLRSGQFDPFDLDPLRQALWRDIDFSALQSPASPKLLVAATRVRDGRQQVFGNDEITADVLLASTCPPLIHCAVEIDGESYWDGGFGGNPPLVRLVQESETSNVLVVQVTPARDSYVPITPAAIDRRLDQITANSVLNAEIAALEWARPAAAPSLRLFRIAAEDEIDGLAQRSATDLGPGFIRQLHRSGRKAAERFLAQDAGSTRIETPRKSRAAEPALL
ncbi:patatin-like phospholipase family protein [Bradyrhizobium sp. Leo121]|uniref:patatin-like phospholipase family protein n=1 Tax=Bradyrhizobium sp. Leo121 TaxID=1571195 RepID=UPI00102A847F|nr:patatin-like phospholipase family protein [Bradyrhizobium sp. Leo121]RZN24076.1 alpha/beta hydrolase [Bradyrhizobium sp. Leo121]